MTVRDLIAHLTAESQDLEVGLEVWPGSPTQPAAGPGSRPQWGPVAGIKGPDEFHSYVRIWATERGEVRP